MHDTNVFTSHNGEQIMNILENPIIRNYRDTIINTKSRSLTGILYNYIYYTYYSNLLNSSDKRLKELHNKHKGERCFIIATGPSLSKTDFTKLNDCDILIGINDLYNSTNHFDIKPKYWLSVGINKSMTKQILSLEDTTVFLSGNAGRHYLAHPNGSAPIIIRNFKEIKVWKELSKDLIKGICGGETVVEYAIQIAYYLGFSIIGLLGCDCSGSIHYNELCNIDHGTVGQRPENFKWDAIMNSYKITADYFKTHMCDSTIINYTVGGNLEYFERGIL